jgi:hypothetical protein
MAVILTATAASTGDLSDLAETSWRVAARQAIEHACYQIANAPLRLYPTPHIYLDEIFPPAFYATLLSHFPKGEQGNSMRYSHHGNEEISEQRHYLSFRDGDYQQLPPTQAAFWQAMGEAMDSGLLQRVAETKFASYLDHPRRLLLGSHQDLLLVNDRTGYGIGPHTDTPQKLFSLLFYCPQTAEHAQLGTSLFRPKSTNLRFAKRTDAWFRHGDDYEQPFANFDKVFTAPYLPNSLFAFVRTRHSYHGVEMTTESAPRQLLIYESFSTRHSRQRKRGGTK